MNRLQTCFATLKTQHRAALIPFITAGDPQPSITVPLMHKLVEAGADVIELGIPFSDPMADGPVIQRASERAILAGTHLCDVLTMVETFRQQDKKTPVVLMGYLNPIEIMGYEKFAQRAEQAGVDGVLTVDLPPEESTDLGQALRNHHLAPIFLLSPTSTEERVKRICTQASGYLYYVSLKGVTGSANLDTDAVQAKITNIRKYTQLPIGVGFGIRDAETAGKIAKISEAVIVGSALVQRIETTAPEQLLTVLPAFLRELRIGMDS
ncbi:tryptophan synthase subunit alpha [Beggiatoa leptomitoformis]|uniref:Tryptophan synthase alpha chain n=1 Tax=Beggiatoa leptomitoformis TaxID=288004 RepID=A0A2N9YBN6_9GAMM|nr:tryptophan synthase subunit alpha [Beggiatoa leptomitoformis]ALG66752.1 tryptophan synthase subunit alpha [Beggiatoa leptomitoformis]AUI67908.1 tryptophan synthase subunit alpha [Beggiatoa leptomitoformis]